MMMTGNWLTGLYHNYSQHLQVNRQQGSQHLQTDRQTDGQTDSNIKTSLAGQTLSLFLYFTWGGGE